ncbi:MAG: DUF6804 family protein [Cyclobacteriaceae bacterium]|jgi:hypothetical protein
MKKLQYLVSLTLLLALGDLLHVYSATVNSIVFLVSAFVFVDEIESKKSLNFYLLLCVMGVFNPFYSSWLEIEQVRTIAYIMVSIFYLLKTSGEPLDFSHSKEDLKQAY